MTTILIDGSNLFVVQYTANPAVGSDGIPIGGCRGFLNSICWINKILKPNRIIIFFDGKGGSAQRKQMFAEYKEGRKPSSIVGKHYKFSSEDKSELNKQYQFDCLIKCLDTLPIDVIIAKDFEADDGIAYSVKYRKQFNLNNAIIVSCDRDFYQLVCDDVSIYNPISKKIINTKSILEEFKIHPQNWLFYRSVSGDKSDAIDGIKGMGPKTLVKLLALESADVKFTIEDVEFLYENINEVFDKKKDKTSIKNVLKLYENKSKIERNWKLMDLTNPLMSNSAKELLEKRIELFEASFKKIELYKLNSNLGLNLNSTLFDDFRFLTF